VPDRDKIKAYADEIGMWAASQGTPPAFGRLLGWLMVCDPAQQTSAELADALRLSKGSVSTGMRMLVRAGLARRVAVPGQRGHAYEIRPDALLNSTLDAIPRWAAMAELLRRGIGLVDADSTAAKRLDISARYFDYVAAKMPQMIEDFKRENGL
jgi:hypothetical protein